MENDHLGTPVSEWLREAVAGMCVVTGGAAASELLSRALHTVRGESTRPRFSLGDGIGTKLDVAACPYATARAGWPRH